MSGGDFNKVMKVVGTAVGPALSFASVVVAAIALNLNITASHTDQRAWVGLTEIGLTAAPVALTPFTVAIVLVNSGKTPAREVVEVGRWTVLPPTTYLDVEKLFREQSTLSRFGVMHPGGKRLMTPQGIMRQQDVDAVASGSSNLYAFGRIDYKDISGGDHWTKFCLVLDRTNMTNFNPCPFYNDAN